MMAIALSARQSEVARLYVLEGLSYEQIATQLGITARTVEAHLCEVRQRTGFDGPGWARRLALSGIIPMGSIPIGK